VYLASAQSTTTLITNVYNGYTVPVFEYFDENYNGTSTALTQPVNPADVRLIKINVKIDLDPNRAPGPVIYSLQTSIRNLKTNL
jgi:hypothetical protein